MARQFDVLDVENVNPNPLCDTMVSIDRTPGDWVHVVWELGVPGTDSGLGVYGMTSDSFTPSMVRDNQRVTFGPQENVFWPSGSKDPVVATWGDLVYAACVYDPYGYPSDTPCVYRNYKNTWSNTWNYLQRWEQSGHPASTPDVGAGGAVSWLQSYPGSDSFEIRSQFADDNPPGLRYYHSPDTFYWEHAFITPAPPNVPLPSYDRVDMLWTQGSMPNSYSLRFGHFYHENGFPLLGPPSEDSSCYYSASFGDSLPSRYCVSRDGYAHYHGYKLDYGRDSLRYRLPYLAELYDYEVSATLFHESKGRVREGIRLGDTMLTTVDVDSGQPVTVWFDIPQGRYLDGTAYLTLKRLSGSQAVLSAIRVYQCGSKPRHQGGGTQTASVSPVSKTGIRSVAPNPFTRHTGICYELGLPGPVSLRIFDVSGRAVRTLERRAGGAEQAGLHTIAWDGRDDRGRKVSNGIYFCRLEAGSLRSSSKIVCLQ
jgi:hypothetical protein